MIETGITHQPLPPLQKDAPRNDCGSELIFHGRVRAQERDENIVALFYEHYAGMAESELHRLAKEMVESFDLAELTCLHRVGEIPVGEASVRIIIRSEHRAEGIAALTSFIRELKQRVPIWKWGVRANGERFPSTHCEGCAKHAAKGN